MIVVIFGPGGAGKGTVVARLLEQDPRLWLSRSWTTRPRRAHEPEDAYHFVDRATFEKAIAQDGFVEWDEHLGNLYGTPKVATPPHQDLVYEIDVNGARSIKEIHDDAVLILIEPPSLDVLAARLKARGDDPDAIQRRLDRATDELSRGRTLADHIVLNDDLTRAVQEVAGILERHRPPGGTT